MTLKNDLKFTMSGDRTIYTVNMFNSELVVIGWWDCGHPYGTQFERDVVDSNFANGSWKVYE